MPLSPMMKFYMTLKESYPDAILLFRLGDFYEMFFDDAKTASEVLGLTLTGRDCGMEERAPMCGVPYHAVDGYISKLIANGYKVAICEQLSDPKLSKGLVERDVIRVITPGTVIEDDILEDKKSNYLACLCADQKEYALAWIDLSTGEFNVLQSRYDDFSAIEDMLITVSPAEILCNDAVYSMAKNLSAVRMGRLPKFQNYYDWAFDYKSANELLCKQFGVATLAIYELEGKKLAVAAGGAMLNYVNETQKRSLAHLSGIKYVTSSQYLLLDANTRRNLELCETARDGSKKATLLWVLDRTRTNMGARNLRRWIEQPLRDVDKINRRLNAVEELTKNSRVRLNLFELLSNIKDIERLTSKIAYANPGPRDLLALKHSLAAVPQIKQLLSQCRSDMLSRLNDSIFELEAIKNLIEDAIDEDAPAMMKDGGYIRRGYNAELDALHDAKTMGKQWLAQLEADEKEKTQIKNLKIGYNKVFGYYIEVSKGNVDKVPFRYQRKQTLTTGERYITQELKEIEDKLIGAVENGLLLESRLFEEIKTELVKVLPHLQSTARGLADCDTVLSLSVAAVENHYCKPQIEESTDCIRIVDGRHPVVEKIRNSEEFVPNDTELDCCQNRTMVITGPNMAGKSTYMRQVALITLMAHIGSFVPAKKAVISLTDRIFTRIGASDDVAYGQSTFMVEMVEVATILQNATYRSLLILDEIGRGTSTFDGLSIARAVMEDVNQRIRCKTLFSTHYHELTEMENAMDGVKNFKIIAAERDKGIIFLHKIMRGGTNKSFGIEVAKLAGLPPKVIARAKEISKILEKTPLQLDQSQDAPLFQAAADLAADPIREELKGIDLDNTSPMQALVILGELAERAKND